MPAPSTKDQKLPAHTLCLIEGLDSSTSSGLSETFEFSDHDSPQDTLLVEVTRLPPEICKMIMDILFEDIFGPKKVYPGRDSPMTEPFLALSKKLYQHYSKIYWSQNNWIIDQGPANDTMRFMTLPPYRMSTTEFSKQRPNEAALKIRRLEICFCTNDLRYPGHARIHGLQEGKAISGCQFLTNYDFDSKSLVIDLMRVWQDKFDRIAFLTLDHLMLDFSKAHAPDGVFLGTDAVQRFARFIYQFPGYLEVRAPTQANGEEIRRILQEMNESALEVVEIPLDDSA